MIPEYLETRSDPRVFGLEVISERPRALGLAATLSSWSQSHPRVLGLEVTLSSVSLAEELYNYDFDL